MLSCLMKRVVPFALAFLFGLAVWQLVRAKLEVLNDIFYLEHGSNERRVRRGAWAYADERSRTWLVIRSMPAAKVVKEKKQNWDDRSVRMRVMFGADGTVSGNEFQLGPSSYSLIEEATAAAKRIEFTPATWNGRPISVWADLTYACEDEFRMSHAPPILRCRLTIDKDSVRTRRGRPWRVITSQ